MCVAEGRCVGAFQDGSTMNIPVSLPPTDITDDMIKKFKKKPAQTVLRLQPLLQPLPQRLVLYIRIVFAVISASCSLLLECTADVNEGFPCCRDAGPVAK